MKLALDTEAVLNCQVCREDIPVDQTKIVIGVRLGPYNRIVVFHPECWRITKPQLEARLSLIGQRFEVKL